ncbi:hypothetical protein IC229_05735 [Spirosoma sp. BT702]|uniref:Uncharacterized protein n=1 Tax=Spirosoma profusum TaxID=2771354 RepID=A0A926XUY9_9BACT|nr:hypothetical protein [Spirosoma profusum]MBD2700126.1 hypothetical protein [Spirosoma profusum]
MDTTETLTLREEALKSEFTALLENFSAVLLDKLMANERKYGFGEAWKIPDWEEDLQRDMVEHIQKGDPRDTAIYSLFAWYHGWRTAPESKRESGFDKLFKWEDMSLSTLMAVLVKHFDCDDFGVEFYSRPSVASRIWIFIKFKLPERYKGNRERYVSGSTLPIVQRRLIEYLDKIQLSEGRLERKRIAETNQDQVKTDS